MITYQEARTTKKLDRQLKIFEDKRPSILQLLASNPNLHLEVQHKFIDLLIKSNFDIYTSCFQYLMQNQCFDSNLQYKILDNLDITKLINALENKEANKYYHEIIIIKQIICNSKCIPEIFTMFFLFLKEDVLYFVENYKFKYKNKETQKLLDIALLLK